MGYGLLNEPWNANMYKDSSLVLDTKKFDREKLTPLYKKVSEAIREVDSTHTVLFEPGLFPNKLPLMGGILSDYGFEDKPDSQGILDDHTYCVMMDPDVNVIPGSIVESRTPECRVFHRRNVEHSKAQATRLGTTVLFSEFGACTENKSCYDEITNSCDAFDKYAVSWTYWMFKGFGDHTTHCGIMEGFYNLDGEL